MKKSRLTEKQIAFALKQAKAMPTSATTLLRRNRKVPLPPVDRPHVIDVDDWVYIGVEPRPRQNSR